MLGDAIGRSRSLSHELSPAVMHHSDFVKILHWPANDIRSKHGLVVHVQAMGEVHIESEAIKSLLYRAAQELLFNATMPVMDGDEATRRIKKDLPSARVIALSMHKEPEMAERMYRAGVEAYVLKTAPSAELLTAIRAGAS
jgi:two-component system, NarL family, nitrate/nitrite response regulator NarL